MWKDLVDLTVRLKEKFKIDEDEKKTVIYYCVLAKDPDPFFYISFDPKDAFNSHNILRSGYFKTTSDAEKILSSQSLFPEGKYESDEKTQTYYLFKKQEPYNSLYIVMNYNDPLILRNDRDEQEARERKSRSDSHSAQDPVEIFDEIVDLFYGDNGGSGDQKTEEHFKNVKPKAIKLISQMMENGVDFNDQFLEDFVMGEYNDLMELYDGNEQIELLGRLLFEELF